MPAWVCQSTGYADRERLRSVSFVPGDHAVIGVHCDVHRPLDVGSLSVPVTGVGREPVVPVVPALPWRRRPTSSTASRRRESGAGRRASRCRRRSACGPRTRPRRRRARPRPQQRQQPGPADVGRPGRRLRSAASAGALSACALRAVRNASSARSSMSMGSLLLVCEGVSQLLECAVHVRACGALAAAEEIADLGVREVLVEPQHDGGALASRQPGAQPPGQVGVAETAAPDRGCPPPPGR